MSEKSFWSRLKDQVNDVQQKELAEKERLKQMDRDGIPYCPKCHSISITANKKGFGFGKAVAGGLVAPIGLLAGGIGANKVQLTCMKCGHQFYPGKK